MPAVLPIILPLPMRYLGDMEKAKEWAARSHTEFEEKDADEYYKMLITGS